MIGLSEQMCWKLNHVQLHEKQTLCFLSGLCFYNFFYCGIYIIALYGLQTYIVKKKSPFVSSLVWYMFLPFLHPFWCPTIDIIINTPSGTQELLKNDSVFRVNSWQVQRTKWCLWDQNSVWIHASKHLICCTITSVPSFISFFLYIPHKKT